MMEFQKYKKKYIPLYLFGYSRKKRKNESYKSVYLSINYKSEYYKIESRKSMIFNLAGRGRESQKVHSDPSRRKEREKPTGRLFPLG
jgi:hypothetical protein